MMINKLCQKACKVAGIVILGFFGLGVAAEFELTGHFDTEGSLFFEEGLDKQQQDENYATSVEPEFYWSFAGGDQSILFAPFLRVDQSDHKRSHYDIREFYWQMVGRFWEVKAGLGKVYWGVTESQHVVDVINQTDILEGTDGEDKFGQPMVNLALIPSFGTLNLLVLPGHRGRMFPGRHGRFRPVGVSIDDDNPLYESDWEEYHVDFGARWFQTLGQLDYGLSYFYGTSREPEFRPTTSIDPVTNAVIYDGRNLRPYYSLIHQVGFEVQYIFEALILKAEEITRIGQGSQFYTLTTGFEYTFANLFNSGFDLGVLSEYHRDDREGAKAPDGSQLPPPNPLDDDIFAGMRVALNDLQSTDLLGGFIVDRNNQTTGYFIEASRRLGERWKLAIESRGFFNTDPADLGYQFRRDDFVKLNLGFYF